MRLCKCKDVNISYTATAKQVKSDGDTSNSTSAGRSPVDELTMNIAFGGLGHCRSNSKITVLLVFLLTYSKNPLDGRC